MSSSANPQSSRASLNPDSANISRVQSIDDARSIKSSKSGHGVRASIEGALDKLRSHGSSSQSTEDDPEGHERRKLEKLLPKRMVSKHRRKKQQEHEEHKAKEEAARGRSIAERGTLEADGSSPSITDNTENSSLLTYESDDDISTNIPPPLASHPSHIGYLTTSSPLVKSASHIDVQDLATASAAASNSNLNLNTIDPQTGKMASLQAPAELNNSRPTSPVGKLKGAFARRSTSPNPKQGSPERKPLPSPAQAVRQQDGDTTRRRGSVAARIGAIFPDRAASPQQSDKPKPGIPTITTNDRPQTPPSTMANAVPAPAIVNTPPTPTEQSSPNFSTRSPILNNPNIITSPTGNMISHRRQRSGTNGSGNHNLGPSKLSNMQSVPLTPTPENGAVTGGLQQQQTGFFGSVFSAAQNAANTLSNSITNAALPGQNRIRSGTQDSNGSLMTKPMDGIEVESAEDARVRSNSEAAPEPAVKTLGMGSLSLDQLGFTEMPSTNVTPVTANFSEAYVPRGRSATVGADDRERSNIIGGQGAMNDREDNNVAVVDDPPMGRTFSAGTYEPSVAGDASPQNGSVFDGKTGRSNSIRSALGAPRRHRGSSVATSTTVGAALPGGVAAGTTPKVTGFAVASKKRNRDFHQLFRSVPDDDYLIEDYSCALQREILAHGRLYVSEGHLCFSSNIFGWVTTLVMSFDEIVSVEKRNTALLFKNGLIISTLHSKNVFASFTSRDSTYDLIVGIWKLGHPSLRSSLNGVRIEETGGGDKTEKDEAPHSGSERDDDEDDEEVYDEDEEYDEEGSVIEEGSYTASEAGTKAIVPSNRKASAMTAKTTATTATKKDDAGAVPAEKDYPGPATHAPTECGDGDTHYEKVIADEVINAPLGKIYDLMFGPKSTAWVSNFLSGDMKCLELTMEEKRGLTKDNGTRMYSYIKPLYASIGPKQTKCVTTETLDHLDLEKCVSVTVSTQTPDVPSGNVFLTKTKYCLTWAEGGGTRIQMNCTIEWTGKSWLKGPIEKGANDGQVTYAKEIVAALKKAVGSSKAGGAAGAGGKRRKGKKGGPGSPKAGSKPTAVVEKTDDWGFLEPLHGILGPIIDIFKPLISGNMVYGLLVGLLVAAWFGYGRQGGNGRREMGMGWSSAERVAAYEEIWRREEGELWEWLEARIGMQGSDGLNGLGMREASPDVKKGIEERLESEVKGDEEVDEAIKVTEEKLRTLKSVVDKRKVKEEGGKKGEAKTRMEPRVRKADTEPIVVQTEPIVQVKKAKTEPIRGKQEL